MVNHITEQIINVAALAAAWIEICAVAIFRRRSIVAALAAAWIEIDRTLYR